MAQKNLLENVINNLPPILSYTLKKQLTVYLFLIDYQYILLLNMSKARLCDRYS